MQSALDREQQLTRELQGSATKVAGALHDGVAFVFALGHAGVQDLRLRAAAGFETTDHARSAAAELVPAVRESLAGESARKLVGEFEVATRLPGGIWSFPLRQEGHLHGALVLGARSAPTAEQQELIVAYSESMALRFDRQRLENACAELREAAEKSGDTADDGDEVLRLSEALFAQDIELLRSNEKLGTIERLKDDFIEKMSRELRTPLNHIIEAIISVLTGEDATLSEDSKRALRGALDEGSLFLRTLQNILDLWRIKQGELPLESQDVNFRELVDEAIFSVQDTIGDRDLVVELDLVEPFPRLRTDLAKLNQILFLLIDNAVKFTPAGRVSVRGEVVDDERLEVLIVDDGIGICHDDQQHIFDEFYQVDEASSDAYRGAGLGLALVRDLTKLMQGTVSIESDIGHGTRVSLSIPVQTL